MEFLYRRLSAGAKMVKG